MSPVCGIFLNVFKCLKSLNFSDSDNPACGKKIILNVDVTQNYAMLLLRRFLLRDFVNIWSFILSACRRPISNFKRSKFCRILFLIHLQTSHISLPQKMQTFCLFGPNHKSLNPILGIQAHCGVVMGIPSLPHFSAKLGFFPPSYLRLAQQRWPFAIPLSCVTWFVFCHFVLNPSSYSLITRLLVYIFNRPGVAGAVL